jgi:hypothetical protein
MAPPFEKQLHFVIILTNNEGGVVLHRSIYSQGTVIQLQNFRHLVIPNVYKLKGQGP